MNNISSALKSHYAQETTTLATCWEVTLVNGTVLGFTSNSSDLVFNGVTYSAASGHIPSAVQTNSSLAVDNLEVSGILASPSITDADLNTGLWDYAKVQLFEVNYMDLTMGSRIIRTGILGQVTTDRNAFKAELRGLMQYLQQPVGRVYGDTCDATFGDARCGLSLTPFTFSGTVTSVSDLRTFSATMSNPSGYFNFGQITFTSGANINRTGEVRSFIAPNLFTTQLQFPFSISIGDTFAAVSGCDKSLVDCDVKFNNSINFRGFFTVPGLDRMLSGT